MDREAGLIAQFLRPLATDPAALGLGDDTALLTPEPGYELALTKDVLVGGVHFLPTDPVDSLAHKILSVNLSDLAAMGAGPRGCLLGLSLPEPGAGAWLGRFATGFKEACRRMACPVLGGDLTHTSGPVILSLTAVGCVKSGAALRRNAARPGDIITVTGVIGQAALGLLALTGRLPSGRDATGFIDAYRFPMPRIETGTGLAGTGAAAMDISDGLVGDLTKLCHASDVAARVMLSRVPLSEPASNLLAMDADLLPVILNGGDDYELLVCAPKTILQPWLDRRDLIEIGEIEQGSPKVRLLDDRGEEIVLSGTGGYSHF